MIDRDTPITLRAIATMMRMEGYRPDAAGVEAFVLDNAADEIDRMREDIGFLRACCSGMAKVIDTTMKDMAQ